MAVWKVLLFAAVPICLVLENSNDLISNLRYKTGFCGE